ncbi:MAG: vitamin B12-dependent ribonucleotide reductase [Anaerolineae bacterium]
MLNPPLPTKSGSWTDSAVRVLEERYLLRDGSRILESPDEMCWRVSRAIAEAEEAWGRTPEEIAGLAERFYDLMVERRFIPNSPTLMNAGKDNALQYSACYVLPVGDSMEEIFESVKRAALIHQSGGGTGFAFSRLRPTGSVVRSTHGVASGPVSFLRVFDAATEAVKQGGTRRGANMGILRVDHPDILEFIHCKLDGGITNFNISVAATDGFMQALAEDRDYDLLEPHSGEVVGQLGARAVFDRITDAAWRTGDPGLVFIDRINHSPANPTPQLGAIEATNPCGEQPLLPNEACNLGSINLAKFLSEADGRQAIDWAALGRDIRLSVRFLDDVIEVNPYPLPEIDAAVKGNRRIGLGVMGWADLLFEMMVPYDSQQALDLAEEVMAFINHTGHEASQAIAEERGPFPNWEGSIYRDGPPLRNATVTTIAPTGSIGIIGGCSSGIEPIFALAFRHIVDERELRFVNPAFQRVAQRLGLWTDDLEEGLAASGSIGGLPEIPEDVRRVFATSHEIAPEWHVRTQAAFQKHTDNGVSKTINLPHSASVADVARAYLLAYETGCLGITVFRDGSKSEQVLHLGTRSGAASPAVEEEISPRPAVLQGVTYRKPTPMGTAFITVNSDVSGEPFEVFANVGKAGSDVSALAEALGRLMSLVLRLPSPMGANSRMAEIIDQLSRIGGARPTGFGPQRIRSLPDAIAQALSEHLGLQEEPGQQLELPLPGSADLCPDCGQAALVHEEGCQKCYNCGYSEC